MQNKFNFTGELYIPKENSKRPLISKKKITTNNRTREYLSLNFGIKESDTNMAFVEGFDSAVDTIQTYDTDNNKIEVDWADRNDPEIVKSVANYRKYIVDLGDDTDGRQEFITQYDMINYLDTALRNYKGKLTVTGTYSRSEYKGTYYDKFRIQNVFAVEEEKKNRLGLTVDFYYNKDSVDKTDYKEDKKIYIDGYILQYVNKDEGNKYFPMRLVFNGSKYDMDNPKHVQLYDYKMQYVDIKNKKMSHIAWEVVLIRGAEEAEFTMDMLTDKQRQQVELGIKELDDFRPRSIAGDKINEFRLFEPVLKDFGKEDNFCDGLVELDMKLSEFEEDIYVPNAKEEKLEVAAKDDEKTQQANDDDNDIDDLF